MDLGGISIIILKNTQIKNASLYHRAVMEIRGQWKLTAEFTALAASIRIDPRGLPVPGKCQPTTRRNATNGSKELGFWPWDQNSG
jgi:hypothetical protein